MSRPNVSANLKRVCVVVHAVACRLKPNEFLFLPAGYVGYFAALPDDPEGSGWRPHVMMVLPGTTKECLDLSDQMARVLRTRGRFETQDPVL